MAIKTVPWKPANPKYRDLAETFIEKESDVLSPPPHHPLACAIENLLGAKFCKPKMYTMAPKEMGELRDFADKNLARGFMQPKTSRMVAPVLLKEKKDRSLRLCVDFCRINRVCMENVHHFLLVKDMLATCPKERCLPSWT